VKLSYCVVNTNGREHLLACLDAIERTHPPGVDHEVIVLDNQSDDGSVAAVRASPHDPQLIELDRRSGKADNDSTLLRAARGEFCLLLNEDAEVLDGAAAALLAALEDDPRAAIAGGQLLSADGQQSPSAWRLPGVPTALAGALFAHRAFTVQSRGTRTRKVGWVQSSAMLVRRSAAAEVDFLDPAFFVYSDETDFAKRLRDAGWRTLYVPAGRAIHHDQLATDRKGARRRMVEFHRNRDLYMRKHHSPAARLVTRLLGVWFYAVRAAAALVIPGHDPRRYLFQARQELTPGRGEGIREAAEEYNRRARIAP
jgi:GT2 family glycosyltransferase